MSFYGNLSSTATRLLKAKGQLFTFTHATGGTSFDPDTGTVTENTEMLERYGIRAQLNPQDDARFAPETLTENRAAKLVIEYADLAVGDEVTLDGDTWTVVGFSPVKPAETGVITKVLIQRVGS